MSAKISISEASRRWNISRQTLYNKINSGVLSVTGKGKARVIDITELIRVFGDVNVDSPLDEQKDSVLHQLIQSKDAMINHLEREIDHLRHQNDLLINQLKDRESLEQKLLEYQPRNGPIFGGWFKNKK